MPGSPDEEGPAIAGKHHSGRRVYVIAEAGVNHDGSEAKARRLIRAAHDAGADAVKFQVFEPDRLVSDAAPTAAYQRQRTGMGRQREMLARLALPREAFRRLAREARRVGIHFLATPFDVDALGFVASLGVRALKIGSGDLTHRPLLEAAGRTGLPVLLSTGMATLEEIDAARRVLLRAGAPRVCLLHCVSLYPTPPERANVLGVRTLLERFGAPVGYSDHTQMGISSIGAVALGATVIEKHLTLDRRAPGPDHAASADPGLLFALVRGIREMERVLGDGRRIPSPEERAVARVARRSLVVARDVARGGRVGRNDLAVLRPAGGISPMEFPRVVGRRARHRLPAGTVLRWSQLEE